MAAAGGRVPVILNASAGLTGAQADSLAEKLGPDAVAVRSVRPEQLQAAVRSALESGAATVGVAGGDGSLRAAAAVLAGTDAVLAVVPTGTLNHFARRIGIHDLGDAATALRSRHIAALPLGTVQDDVFLNTLTFGEYSRIVRLRERFRGAIGKWPAAAVAFAIALVTVRRMTVRLHAGDESLRRTTPFVWVGVGWGSFPRVHEALERREEPDLEVTVLRAGGTLDSLGFLLRLGVRMLRREQPIRDRALDVLHTPSLTLELRHRIDATADGEVLRLQPPVRVGVRPRALRVLLGPHAEGPPPPA